MTGMDGTGTDKSGGDEATAASSAELHSVQGDSASPSKRQGRVLTPRSAPPDAPTGSRKGPPEPADLNLPCPTCGLKPSDIRLLLNVVEVADALCNGGHDALTKVRITNHLRQAVALLKS